MSISVRSILASFPVVSTHSDSQTAWEEWSHGLRFRCRGFSLSDPEVRTRQFKRFKRCRSAKGRQESHGKFGEGGCHHWHAICQISMDYGVLVTTYNLQLTIQRYSLNVESWEKETKKLGRCGVAMEGATAISGFYVPSVFVYSIST